jgi:hypothetical protein
MAQIIEGQRKIIRLSTEDVFNIIREYQQLTYKCCCYEHKREILKKFPIYIPEDL